jgi:hypothetical protein
MVLGEQLNQRLLVETVVLVLNIPQVQEFTMLAAVVQVHLELLEQAEQVVVAQAA